MERLTNKTFDCMMTFCDARDCVNYEIDGCCSFERYRRLAHYEDMEEQGRLVVLPCKVGTTVWSSEPFVDGQPRDGDVVEINIDEHGVVLVVNFDPEPVTAFFNISDFGKTVFLTREEAEQALKEGVDHKI